MDPNTHMDTAIELTKAWLSGGSVNPRLDEVISFLTGTRDALAGLGGAPSPATQAAANPAQPAVTERKSLANPKVIISMIDGKPYKMLKRHLAKHGLTPDQYRERFGLKPNYPMTSPEYSARRTEMAKASKLGHWRKGKVNG